MTNSRQAVYGYDQRLELFGSKGMVFSENQRSNHVTRHFKDSTEVSGPLLNFFIERYAEAFNMETGSFVKAVTSGTAVDVGLRMGRLALVLAEAAITSINEERTVPVSEIV